MLRLAVATNAETYERMREPLADRGIEADAIETAERSIHVTGDDENGAGQFGDSFDVGFVFPPRLAGTRTRRRRSRRTDLPHSHRRR